MLKDDLILSRWWETGRQQKIKCTLCPRYCQIEPGQSGFCYIRKNIDGQLYSLGYGKPTGFAVDPIEKKPLNHFYPGSAILSFGTAGCNLGCKFCQNWHMSKAKMDDMRAHTASPDEVVRLAIQRKTPSIAFTYNDPIIFGEYVIDISKIARKQGINSVMVTNGYIDKEARKDVFQYIDAANVDLKAFSERFYHKLTHSHLKPVLDTLNWLSNETDVWIEITTLLIPDENDSDEELQAMCDWILENMGEDVPLHFTAFHPDFHLMDKPGTPESTLTRARKLAMNAGVKYCYVGNIRDPQAQSTFCPSCKKELIGRDWYSVNSIRIVDGKCPYCKTKIAARWG